MKQEHVRYYTWLYRNHNQHLHITSVRQAVLGPIQDVVSFRFKIYWNNFPRIHCSPIASGCDNVKFWELNWMGLNYWMEKWSQEKPRLLQNIWLFFSSWWFAPSCFSEALVHSQSVVSLFWLQQGRRDSSSLVHSSRPPKLTQPGSKNGEQMNEYLIIQYECIIQRFPLNTKIHCSYHTPVQIHLCFSDEWGFLLLYLRYNYLIICHWNIFLYEYYLYAFCLHLFAA